MLNTKATENYDQRQTTKRHPDIPCYKQHILAGTAIVVLKQADYMLLYIQFIKKLYKNYTTI